METAASRDLQKSKPMKRRFRPEGAKAFFRKDVVTGMRATLFHGWGAHKKKAEASCFGLNFDLRFAVAAKRLVRSWTALPLSRN